MLFQGSSFRVLDPSQDLSIQYILVCTGVLTHGTLGHADEDSGELCLNDELN